MASSIRTTSGSSARAKGIEREIRRRLPWSTRKHLTAETGKVILSVPAAEAAERHKWLDDGRLQSTGTKTVKLLGRAKAVTFRVFTPSFIEHVLDSGLTEVWREEDIVTTAENRRRASAKAALTRAGKRPAKLPKASPNQDEAATGL